MTLIELLVVIFIVVTVTALAIPVVAPAMRGRQIREASRLITAYLAGARSEALRTGRSTGVIIECFPDIPEMSTSLSRCQVPQVYAGVAVDSRATTSLIPNSTSPLHNTIDLTDDPHWDNSASPTSSTFFQEDDLIRFNYQGHIYRLEFDHVGSAGWFIGSLQDLLPLPNGDGTKETWVQNCGSTNASFVTPTGGVPYQVFRQPRRTATPPVQLPPGIVIDLSFSGDAQGPFVVRDRTIAASNLPSSDYEDDPFVGSIPANHNAEGIMVVFAPDGSVEAVWRPDPTNPANRIRHVPSGSIHLLIGQRERIPVTAVETLAGLEAIELQNATDTDDAERLTEEQLATFNFMDLENLWITINPRSGLVASTEMSAVPPIDDPEDSIHGGTTTTPIRDRVDEALSIAREGQAMGGL